MQVYTVDTFGLTLKLATPKVGSPRQCTLVWFSPTQAARSIVWFNIHDLAHLLVHVCNAHTVDFCAHMPVRWRWQGNPFAK
jgi:hypothetical protein